MYINSKCTFHSCDYTLMSHKHRFIFTSTFVFSAGDTPITFTINRLPNPLKEEPKLQHHQY